MSLPERRQTSRLSPLADLLNFPFEDWRSFFLPTGTMETRAIRVEDYVEDGHYVVRAELPGIDPEKDVEITLADDVLSIHAERREERKEALHSEFRYGEFTRSVALPPGVDPKDIQADYDQGVLTVKMPVPQGKKEAQRIAVHATQK